MRRSGPPSFIPPAVWAGRANEPGCNSLVESQLFQLLERLATTQHLPLASSTARVHGSLWRSGGRIRLPVPTRP